MIGKAGQFPGAPAEDPNMDFEVKPTGSGIGAEILGLDLSRPISEATQRALYDVWLDAGILVFRGVGTSPERHLALSRAFGDLDVHPVESVRLEGHPEIIELTSRGKQEPIVHYIDDEPIVGRIPWHSDMIYTTRPCRGALLRMIERPARGGETGWIDTAAAYDALLPALKKRIEGLEARFDFVVNICDMRFGKPSNMRFGTLGTQDYGTFTPVAHTLVWTHPESGRKSLVLSPIHLIEMVGMAREEGDALLQELVDHTISGRFTYLHDWQSNDMVLWDNWRTMHTALGTPLGLHRVVQRTSIKGEREVGRFLA